MIALLLPLSGCLDQRANNNAPEQLVLKGLSFNTNVTYSLDLAKEQDKPLFVYARSEECGWCKKFEQETFTDKSVIKILKENFILLSIDVYKQKEERKYFSVQGTPAEIFLYPNRTEIKRIPGYTETETFLNLINEIVNTERTENETRK